MFSNSKVSKMFNAKFEPEHLISLGIFFTAMPLTVLALLATITQLGFDVNLRDAIMAFGPTSILGAILLLIACLGMYLKRRKKAAEATTPPHAKNSEARGDFFMLFITFFNIIC